MIPQFSTTTLSSFHLWLDNWITQRGQAYTNTSSRLYYQADSGWPGFVAYASPFRSWVCDSGVSGALIADRISGTYNLSHGQSGMYIDYENGRVLLPAALGVDAVLSGSYAFKDLNAYKANETLEKIVFENKYYLNSRYARPITGIPPPNTRVTPCMFVVDAATHNEPFAFGGVYATTMTATVVVMAETLNQLEGSLSLINDAQDAAFAQLPLSAWPLNAYGDWKGGSGYNYETLKAAHATPGNLFDIAEVRTSKVPDADNMINPGIFLGVADVTIVKPRTIH